jgi:tellurium resistance protein TerD
MSVSLEKGSKLDLNKAAADAGATSPLKKVLAGAGWDPKQEGAKIDLDLIGIKLGSDGKAIKDANSNGTNYDEAVNFYKNLNTMGAIHSGDSLDGEGDGDDETITYDLSAIEPEVEELVFVVAGFSGQKFDEVENIKLRVVNADDNSELVVVDNTGLTTGNSVEVARVKRNGGNWSVENSSKLLTVGEGKSGTGLIKAVLESYGVTGL